jgi:hypothetical protein
MNCYDYKESKRSPCSNCFLSTETKHCWVAYYTEELDKCIEQGTVQKLLQALINEPKPRDYLNYLYIAVKYNRPELMIHIDKLRLLK